jgi:hypothetical protein
MHKEKIPTIYDGIATGIIKANEKNLSILPDDLCAKLALNKKIDEKLWKKILEQRRGLAKAYHTRTLLTKYTRAAPFFNMQEACKHNDIEVVQAHLEFLSPESLNKNFVFPMPPGFLSELPLAVAVKARAMKCIRLLIEHGADPDAFCRHPSNQKTPRELADGISEILQLFDAFSESKKPMIVLKVDEEEYTIRKDNSVSDGEYKPFIEEAIEMIRSDYGPSKGFWPPYLYLGLNKFKWIELVSLDFTFPPHDPNIMY